MLSILKIGLGKRYLVDYFWISIFSKAFIVKRDVAKIHRIITYIDVIGLNALYPIAIFLKRSTK